MSTANRSGFARRLIALVRKEVKQLLRDRSNLMVGIALPGVLILIFGYGLSFDVKHAPVAVVLEDPSPMANDVMAGMRLSPYLDPKPVHDMHAAEALMADREVNAILRIPSDFSRRLHLGDAHLQLILHGADANTARTVQGYVESSLQAWAAEQEQRAGDTATPIGMVHLEQRLWFNEANTSTWFLVPGLLVLITTLVGAFLTALVMAREWERGTLEALFVTPVRPLEILLAKIIPYFVVGLIGLAMCLLAARFLFEVPLRGSLLLIVLLSVFYMFVALGIGLLISAVTKNQFNASQIALIASFLPALMLSGFIYDLRNMPWPVQVVGHALPATYYLEALKSLFLAGNLWSMVLRNCAILFGYAVVLLAAARLKTRKRIG
ncbi:ABC transporter permease [Luteibacter flocculans]|uniref:ABC transporter permease n=1 Tax=Luteibacter flocculans TaxID=2780091 RepID=A0ABY4SVY4_9GAMM|nr:ABC transporter permease [Luteibacter flocculans]URL56861.1 ABC transporter permease [Luteibacter flocculans]